MPGAFDFLSPFFTAAIVTDPSNREFTRYPLWTFDRIDAQSPGPTRTRQIDEMGSLAFLSEISVKLNLGYVPRITATLTPPFEAGRKFIDSPLIEWATSTLEVQYGYSSPRGVVASPLWTGLLLKPEVTLGADISISLTAQGIGGFGATRSESGEPEQNKSLRDVFLKICDKNKMTLDDSRLQSEEASEENLAFNEKQPSITVGWQSEWYYLVKSAISIGCWVYEDMDGEAKTGKSKLVLLPINATVGSAPRFQFRLFDFPGGKFGPENGVFPILGFSSPTSAVYLSAATQKVFSHGYDSNKRESVTVEVSDKTANVVRTNDGQTGLANSPQSGGSLLPQDASTPDAKKIAENEYKTMVNNMGVKIEVETVGCPNLVPGTVVSIAGVSKNRFDGKYTVFEVEHTLGSGGFSTKFVAFSNAGDLSDRVGSALKAKSANTQSFNDATSDAELDRTDKMLVFPSSGGGVIT